MAVPPTKVIELTFIIQHVSKPDQFYPQQPSEIILPSSKKSISEYTVTEYLAYIISECEQKLGKDIKNIPQKEDHDKIMGALAYYQKSMEEYVQTKTIASVQVQQENFQKNPALFVEFIKKKTLIRPSGIDLNRIVKTKKESDEEAEREAEQDRLTYEWISHADLNDLPQFVPPPARSARKDISTAHRNAHVSTNANASANASASASANANASAIAMPKAQPAVPLIQNSSSGTLTLSGSFTPAQQLPFSGPHSAFSPNSKMQAEERAMSTSSPNLTEIELSLQGASLALDYFTSHDSLKACVSFEKRRSAAIFLNIMLQKEYCLCNEIIMYKTTLPKHNFIVIVLFDAYDKFRRNYAIPNKIASIMADDSFSFDTLGECEQVYPPLKIQELTKKLGLETEKRTAPILDSLKTNQIHDKKLWFQAHWGSADGKSVDTKLLKDQLALEKSSKNKNKTDKENKSNIEITIVNQFSIHSIPKEDFSKSIATTPLTFKFYKIGPPRVPLCQLTITRTGDNNVGCGNAAPTPALM